MKYQKLHTLIATILLVVWCSGASFAATTLLPNGKQCFTIGAGLPAISGSLNMYFVGTNNPKPTWQDGGQVTLNSQPIQLDAQGCAILYGVGAYRQQLFDGPVVAGVTTGNLIWDQTVTDTSAFNSTFWAGIAGGTPNVITVVDTGFNATDGTIINFTALATNTGATTINPSGFGAIVVVKDTASGPVSLTGGEIVQNNIISVVYSATGNNFHLLNTAIASPSGNSAPLCGATGLVIANSSGTPNSIIQITATQALTQSTSGQVLNRSTVSTTVNISTGTVTSTAGGMDGELPGTSNWLNIFLIDNGSAIAGLATLATGNGLTPNMPSGYTYKCLVGAMRVDASGNLHRIRQTGIDAQYIVSAATTTQLPVVLTGANGTFSDTANPMTAWVATTVRGNTSQPIPALGTVGRFAVTNTWANGAVSRYVVAPNALYGGNSTTNPSPCGQFPNGNNGAIECEFIMEADTVQTAASAAGFGLQVRGYRLGGVNAN